MTCEQRSLHSRTRSQSLKLSPYERVHVLAPADKNADLLNDLLLKLNKVAVRAAEKGYTNGFYLKLEFTQSDVDSRKQVDELHWLGGLYSGSVNYDNIPHGQGTYVTGLDPNTREMLDMNNLVRETGILYCGSLQNGFWHNGVLTRKISSRSFFTKIE